MAFVFSKGKKNRRGIGFLDGANGPKQRSISPFVPTNNKGIVGEYLTEKGAFNSTLMLDQSPLNNGTRRTGEEGRCYLGDGIDDEVNFGDSDIFSFGNGISDNSFSVCFRASFNDSYTSGSPFGKSNGVFIGEYYVGHAGSFLYFTLIDQINSEFMGKYIPFSDTSWHDFIFTYDGSGAPSGIKIFIDGVLQTSFNNDTGGYVAMQNTSVPLKLLLGRDSGLEFDGNILDVRLYDKELTQDEVTYYSTFGESGHDPLVPIGWWKCDEQSGTICYDSSGNANHGTITNATLATFHATQNVWSFQNQVGYSPARNFIKNSSNLQDAASWNNLNITVESGFTDPDGGSSAFKFTATSTSATLFTNKTPYATASQSGNYCFSVLCKRGNTDSQFGNFLLRNSTTASNIVIGVFDYGTNVLSLIGIGNYGGSATLVSDGWYLINMFSDSVSAGNALICYCGATGGTYNAGNFAYLYAPQLSEGTSRGDYQKTNGIQLIESVVLPRDESDISNDVLGNPLTYTGRRPNDFKLTGSNCLTADGTLYIAAAHLVGTETVISSGGTSTPTISAGRIDFTAGTCWDLTLSDVTHYPLSEGWGVDIGSSTSDNDGTLTNSVLANAWGATQDEYHYNILNGFSLYEHASTAAIRWPFKNGAVKTLTPPAGYSKTSDNYAGDYHNDAETTIDFNPDSTPEMGATQLGITVPSAHAFGDAFTASDQIFSRQRTKTEDRFLVFTEAQTGSALTNIQKYTQP